MPLTPTHIKIYTAILNQAGTDNPTAKILHNTISENPVIWIRENPGLFRGTLAGAFPQNKTITFTSDIYTGYKIQSGIDYDNMPNAVQLEKSNIQTLTPTDGLDDVIIEIRVYGDPHKDII